jgi:spermidine/putrescine transport system permease protein
VSTVPRRPRRGWRSPRQLLLLPTAGWTLALFLGPLVLLVVYSFGSIDLLTFQVQFGWTLSNYGDVFSDLYLETIGRSLLLSVGSTLGCLVIGFPLAYAISRQRGKWQVLLLIGVMVPFWTSFVVRTYGLVNLLDDNGPLADLLQWLGLVDNLRLLYTPWSIAIGMVYTYLPLMVLPVYATLERMDWTLVDAATDLGDSPFRAFRRVTLPLALPGIAAGSLLVFIPLMGEYLNPVLLGGDLTVYAGNLIAQQFLTSRDWPFGSAIAMVVVAAMTLLVLAYAKLASRQTEYGS